METLERIEPPATPLTASAVLSKMHPRNMQLGKLVARVASRGIQEQVISHWNRTRRLPEGFLHLPFLSSSPSRQEALV